MNKRYQVNAHYWAVDNVTTHDIVECNADGYVGRTWGTYYANGSYDYTDWCIFAGTYEECVNYVNDKNKQL